MTHVVKHKELEPLIGAISDIEDFLRNASKLVGRMEERREGLEGLKDELLIYGDEEFMQGLRRAEEDIKAGRITRCDTPTERRKLFDSL